jgi:hypothetical protein
VTTQGSAYGRFRRAISSGNGPLAWTAAAELPMLNLADALALLLLQTDVDRARYQRGLVRWHARLCLETPQLTAEEASLTLTALQALGGAGERGAATALRYVCAGRGLNQVADVIDRWSKARS